MRTWGRLRGGLGVLLLVVSCGRDADVVATGSTDPAERHGACPPGSEGNDRPDAVGFLAEAERWVEVVAFRGPPEVPDEGSALVDMEVLPVAVGGGPTGAGPRADRMRMWADHVDSIDWALSNGVRVFLPAASRGYESELLLTTVMLEPGGRVWFGGTCAFIALTKPLRSSLGPDADAKLRDVIGRTDAGQIRDALAPTPAPAGATPGS